MEFWTYTSLFDTMNQVGGIKKGQGYQDFYRESLEAFAHERDVISTKQATSELAWFEADRPYYSVFPGICSMLCRLPLEIDSGLIHPPMEALLVRFPKDPAKNPLRFSQQGEYAVRSILLSETEVNNARGIALWIDIGEQVRAPQGIDVPVYNFRNFRTVPGRTVEQDITELPVDPSAEMGIQLPEDFQRDLVRLVCTLCLLGDDPSVIEPDVLAKDRAKWEASKDPKFVSKAHRRGKKGWLVGAHLEVIPHVRRPHPALVWTGKGRMVPRIVMRKGSIVHRHKVEQIPHGLESIEEGEREPSEQPDKEGPTKDSL